MSDVEVLNEKEEGRQQQREGREEVLLSDDPIEKMAVDYGWDPNGKRSAEEYIKYALDKFPERGEALSKQARKIEDKDSELSKMKVILNELSSHMKKQKNMEEQNRLNAIEEYRNQAIQNGDVQLVKELDQQKLQVHVPEPVQDFMSRHNEWFNGMEYEHLEMREWVDRQDKILGQRGLAPAEHIKILEANLHKKFPNYFNKSNEEVEVINRTDTVDSLHNSNVVGKSNRKKSYAFEDLSKEQKEAAKYLEKQGMSVSDYIKQLVEFGDLQ